MNGDWYPWGTQSDNPDGNSPADYIAWRHVHDIFTSVGATNVRWLWSLNITYQAATPASAIYPGDSYVDWVGIDGYNTGSPWKSAAALLDETYNAITAVTNKPMLIAETASAETGGDKGSWITQTFDNDIPTTMPAVRGIIWFDADEGIDWRVNSSASSLAAYRAVVASPSYEGALP
jgi:beta-mannanase